MKTLKLYWLWLPLVWACLIILITSVQLPEKQEKKREVAFVMVSYKHEHARKLVDEFKREAKQRGYEPIIASSEDSRILEKEKMEALIDRNVESIFLTTLDGEFMGPTMERARQAGIPIVAIDRMITHEAVITSVISDNTTIGRMAGDFLANSGLKLPIRVVEVQGTPGVRPTIDRNHGFEEYLKTDGRFVRVASLNGNYDPFQSELEMERWLKKGTDFDAVFTHNDDIAFGVVRALEKMGIEDKTIVSVDGVSGIYPLIHAGKVAATAVQSPQEMIEIAFGALEQHNSGQPLEEHYYSRSYLYTR